MSYVSTLMPPGTAPKVVISVPHDWLKKYDSRVMFNERPVGWHRRDTIAWESATAVAESLNSGGISTQIIRWLAPRRYCDVNRPRYDEEAYGTHSWGSAYDDERMATDYEKYHNLIDWELQGSIGHHGRDQVMFFDWHSFDASPESSVAQANAIFGTAGCSDESCDLLADSLMRHLCQKRLNSFHSGHNGASHLYGGGYTERRVAACFGIRALQVEVHERLWTKSASIALVQAISDNL